MFACVCLCQCACVSVSVCVCVHVHTLGFGTFRAIGEAMNFFFNTC